MVTCFGPFAVDADTRQLRGDERDIRISPKAFDLLITLLDARPRVLSKAELLDRLWPDTCVAEANLSNLVAELRAALGDSTASSQFIRTAHRRGYAFCGAATAALAPATNKNAPICWLVWGQRRFLLGQGEHLIGRDQTAHVCLEAPTVSRHHARLLVGTGGVLLEDLGSRNGTFLAEDRISGCVRLRDGDLVRIGSLTLTLRVPHESATTIAGDGAAFTGPQSR